MVEGGGFEPPKVEPADLQSDPFGRSGTPPYLFDQFSSFLQKRSSFLYGFLRKRINSRQITSHQRLNILEQHIAQSHKPEHRAIRKTRQNVISHASIRRPTYTNPQPEKIFGPSVGYYVSQTVMPSMTTIALEPHHAFRQLKLIMNNQKLAAIHLIKPHQRTDRCTTSVHKGHWLQQQHPTKTNAAICNIPLKLSRARPARSMHFSQTIHKQKPGIMPGSFVLLTRIT